MRDLNFAGLNRQIEFRRKTLFWSQNTSFLTHFRCFRGSNRRLSSARAPQVCSAFVPPNIFQISDLHLRAKHISTLPHSQSLTKCKMIFEISIFHSRIAGTSSQHTIRFSPEDSGIEVISAKKSLWPRLIFGLGFEPGSGSLLPNSRLLWSRLIFGRGFEPGSGSLLLIPWRSRARSCDLSFLAWNRALGGKRMQHLRFPHDHSLQYLTGLPVLNCPNRTGWGAFTGVWPHPRVLPLPCHWFRLLYVCSVRKQTAKTMS